MSETTERAKEFLNNAEATDQQSVTIPVPLLQLLVDQAELRSSATLEAATKAMDEALERWAATSQRQIEAQNRLIEQNRILQRRVAESQASRPLE